MLKEFKEFALKGNVVDLAVAVIIAGAFGLIIKSLVDDVFMPIVGAVFGGVDFTNKFWALSDGITATTLAEAKEQGAVIAYGNFIQTGVNFVIIAFILFMVVRGINSMQKKEEEAAAEDPKPSAEDLLTEIRDALKKK